jgi:hypothetical protein
MSLQRALTLSNLIFAAFALYVLSLIWRAVG